MIDLKDLRSHPEKYRKGAADKADNTDIDALLRLDSKYRALLTQQQALVSEKNKIGKQIGQLAGQLKKSGEPQRTQLEEQMAALQQRPHEIKTEQASLDEQVYRLEQERNELWLSVPQPADPEVPVGRGYEDNIELRCWNPDWFDPSKPFVANKGFEGQTHIDLGAHLGLIDLERGVKIAGSRSYVLIGDGMRLHNAILRYAFDFMTNENGFTALSVSDLVRHEMMVGTGFFPKGRDQVYDIANPTGEYGLALSGTGEVGLMGFHQDEILNAKDLPRCYTTLSTCFRREAGAAGKDTAGLYRIHQFDKVEQVVICRADEQESRRWHQRMIGYVETLLQRLEVPYRLLQCCTGDLGPKNADMIDIESWMPSRNAYGETHSASRLYDYQCRRLNLRYRDTNGTQFCHALNNTVVASPRILIPLLELYQNQDSTITIPRVLRPYLGGQDRIEPTSRSVDD